MLPVCAGYLALLRVIDLSHQALQLRVICFCGMAR
jgi:hypothetical protein